MTWNAYTTGVSYKRLKNKHITVLLIAMLLSLMSPDRLNNTQWNTRTAKLPIYSNFTNPPLIPVTPAFPLVATKRCNSTSSALKEGIKCFKNKHYDQAKTILIRVRKEAIKNENRELLFKSKMYLAFISIDQGDVEIARKKIKHLFFLRANFTLKQYKINNANYSTMFKEIHQHGRNAGEKEIDDISGSLYKKVSSCYGTNCKNKVWKKVKSNFTCDKYQKMSIEYTECVLEQDKIDRVCSKFRNGTEKHTECLLLTLP